MKQRVSRFGEDKGISLYWQMKAELTKAGNEEVNVSRKSFGFWAWETVEEAPEEEWKKVRLEMEADWLIESCFVSIHSWSSNFMHSADNRSTEGKNQWFCIGNRKRSTRSVYKLGGDWHSRRKPFSLFHFPSMRITSQLWMLNPKRRVSIKKDLHFFYIFIFSFLKSCRL